MVLVIFLQFEWNGKTLPRWKIIIKYTKADRKKERNSDYPLTTKTIEYVIKTFIKKNQNLRPRWLHWGIVPNI